eukprot:UN34492
MSCSDCNTVVFDSSRVEFASCTECNGGSSTDCTTASCVNPEYNFYKIVGTCESNPPGTTMSFNRVDYLGDDGLTCESDGRTSQLHFGRIFRLSQF